MNDPAIEPLAYWLKHSQNIAFLTGAGVSTESGIPDFRSAGGFWEDDHLVSCMTDGYLRAHPEKFWRVYKEVFVRPEYLAAEPNAAHLGITHLQSMGKNVDVFTQNIDGLHDAAGTENVYELHGSMRFAECPRCHNRYTLDHILSEEVPMCHWMDMKGGICETVLHPDTVLFDQPVRYFHDAVRSIRACDLLLVMGTSLTVEPVASLPMYTSRDRTKLVIINLDGTHLDGQADLVIRRKVGDVFRDLSDTILNPDR